MDIYGYWISVGYGCLSIQTKNRLSISSPILSKSMDIRLSDYPIGALEAEAFARVWHTLNAIDDESKTSLEDVFFSTNILQHTAVHRLLTSAKGIHKMILSAARLAKTLGDQPPASQLARLHLEIENRLKDMEINKNFLENRAMSSA
jgi:hypothetical protein